MTSQFGSGVSYAGLPSGVLDVVSRNPLPALIVEVPSERVVAVSPAAQDLFSSRRRRLVGCTLESLTAETPKGALDLLVAGRLNGYEANHQFRLGDGSSVPLQTWVRTIGEEIPLRHVLFLFTTEGMPAASTAPALPKEFNALIGTIDASLRIDRVCNDGDTSLDGPMGLVGQSIFQIVHLEDLTGLMWALAQSTSTAKGVALHVHVHRGHGQAQLCQMLLLPMDPPRHSLSRSGLSSSPKLRRGMRLTRSWARREATMSLARRTASPASANHRSLACLSCRRASSTCLRGCLPGTGCRPSQRCSSSLRAPSATISPRSSGS